MTITVKFQGIIADMLGRKAEQIDLPAGATVDDLYTQLTAHDDTARAILKQTRPFINGQQADRAAPLPDGAEVIFMRPIAGGAGLSAVSYSLLAPSLSVPSPSGKSASAPHSRKLGNLPVHES